MPAQQRKEQTTVIIMRNAKLNAEKMRIYLPTPFGYADEYFLNVIRLARDAIRVPHPPMFTPYRRAR